MKHWMIFTGVSVTLITAFSSAYAVDGYASPEKIMPAEDVSIRTAYELRAIGGGNEELFYSLEKRIKGNEKVLKQGACEWIKVEKGKGAPLISIGCDKPSAKTDSFFRSLLVNTPTGRSGKSSATDQKSAMSSSPVEKSGQNASPAEQPGQGLSLRAYSLAIPSTCTFDYCCGVTQAEACKKINRTKPCTVCPTY